jgi:hypothetical protein
VSIPTTPQRQHNPVHNVLRHDPISAFNISPQNAQCAIDAPRRLHSRSYPALSVECASC